MDNACKIPTEALELCIIAVSNAPDPADLVISVSRKDLEALAQGKLNPMTAAITGRLKVSDMGLAMSLMPQVKALLEARTGEA